jgi:hypothetical protein
MTKVAVIYYSATGNVHALAEGVADGAAEAGAEVRLRRVTELAPAEAIDAAPPGYTDPSLKRAGGNPYGTSHASADGPPGSDVLEAARYQGRRLAAITASIAGAGREQRLAAA